MQAATQAASLSGTGPRTRHAGGVHVDVVGAGGRHAPVIAADPTSRGPRSATGARAIISGRRPCRPSPPLAAYGSVTNGQRPGVPRREARSCGTARTRCRQVAPARRATAQAVGGGLDGVLSRLVELAAPPVASSNGGCPNSARTRRPRPGGSSADAPAYVLARRPPRLPGLLARRVPCGGQQRAFDLGAGRVAAVNGPRGTRCVRLPGSGRWPSSPRQEPRPRHGSRNPPERAAGPSDMDGCDRFGVRTGRRPRSTSRPCAGYRVPRFVLFGTRPRHRPGPNGVAVASSGLCDRRGPAGRLPGGQCRADPATAAAATTGRSLPPSLGRSWHRRTADPRHSLNAPRPVRYVPIDPHLGPCPSRMRGWHRSRAAV